MPATTKTVSAPVLPESTPKAQPTAMDWALTELDAAILSGDAQSVGRIAGAIKLRSREAAAAEHGDPLVKAARHGSLEIVKILAARCSLEQRDRMGNTALMAAAASGNDEAGVFLLNAGASAKAFNAEGNTALSLLLGAGDSVDDKGRIGRQKFFDQLLPLSDALRANRNGFTPLMFAAMFESDHYFNALLPLSDAAALTKREISVVSFCLDGARDNDTDGSANLLRKLEAVREIAPPELWRHHNAGGNLMHEAICAELLNTAEWLAGKGLGVSPNANEAFAELLRNVPTTRELSLAERLLPFVDCRAALPKGKTLLGDLMGQMDPARPHRDATIDWALADLLASADPLQPQAKEAWERGGPDRLPRLNAAVEAEWLRRAVRERAPVAQPAKEAPPATPRKAARL